MLHIKTIDLEYFPKITSFINLYRTTNVVFNAYQTYNKRLPLNRCVVAGANGRVILSVPLQDGRNQRKLLKDVLIQNDEMWQARQWKTLQSLYNASPFFFQFKDELADIYLRHFRFLVDWNYTCLSWILEKMKAEINIDLQTTEPEAKYVTPVLTNTMNENLRTLVYRQVYQERTGFLPDLSVLDMLFCVGPFKAAELLQNAAKEN